MPRQIWTLTQEDASFLVDHSVKTAAKMGVAITVAVVEAGGVTVGLLRMDDTKLASVCVAEGKAWTSALFQKPSNDYGSATAPGSIGYGLQNAFPGKLVPMIGGQPVFVHGTCIGGVGVSGASGEQDDSIAKAAVAAFLMKRVTA